jgi:hypothetical protein
MVHSIMLHDTAHLPDTSVNRQQQRKITSITSQLASGGVGLVGIIEVKLCTDVLPSK